MGSGRKLVCPGRGSSSISLKVLVIRLPLVANRVLSSAPDGHTLIPGLLIPARVTGYVTAALLLLMSSLIPAEEVVKKLKLCEYN